MPKKVHSEIIFAMHRIILIIRQKDLSHLVHIFYSCLDFIEKKRIIFNSNSIEFFKTILFKVWCLQAYEEGWRNTIEELIKQCKNWPTFNKGSNSDISKGNEI